MYEFFIFHKEWSCMQLPPPQFYLPVSCTQHLLFFLSGVDKPYEVYIDISFLVLFSYTQCLLFFLSGVDKPYECLIPGSI